MLIRKGIVKMTENEILDEEGKIINLYADEEDHKEQAEQFNFLKKEVHRPKHLEGLNKINQQLVEVKV